MLAGHGRVQFAGLLGIILGAAAFVGCGGGGADDQPREAVSGSVTLDGQPLAHGYIQFQPTDHEGVAAGGAVTDGKYTIERAEGPAPGSYRVMISTAAEPGAASDVPPPPPGEPTPPPPDPIPAKYNSESTLTAQVEAGQTNSFDFELSSK